MNTVLFIQIGGIFHLICACSHLFFPKTFRWEENLKELPADKKKRIKNILYLSNTCTLLFWLILSYIPLFYAEEVLQTPMGRAFLTLLVLFWTVRIFVLQPIFSSYKTREFWVRTIFFSTWIRRFSNPVDF
jgi:hypothetical protein